MISFDLILINSFHLVNILLCSKKQDFFVTMRFSLQCQLPPRILRNKNENNEHCSGDTPALFRSETRGAQFKNPGGRMKPEEDSFCFARPWFFCHLHSCGRKKM